MENIGGGMTSQSKSAVAPICLGPRLEQKTAQKAAMSFLSFSINFRQKSSGGEDFYYFLMDTPSF